MRIVIIGASGTIGRRLSNDLKGRHEIITAGRTSGMLAVDIAHSESIREMFEKVGPVDACVCVAASGAMDDFEKLTASDLCANLRSKLVGQIDVVLTGKNYISDNGSFTLTSGIFADEAWPGVTGGAVISGGLHSFVLSAAIELNRGLRVNVVSPSMVNDSIDDFGHLFPGLKPVSMEQLVAAYVDCIEGRLTGQVIKVY
ncbi:short chain dehydrogenase [Rhizobium lusitanum]|uniref:Short chain dehydrogenase n=1 Tax=Rhizobium lusitanum TaxID=293958 RepID=A0A6L9UKL5_9HYPH|nr:short chain dehydrogenase [Rhizobium lusitanum]NEI74380.1 short chain dehydrogenase [Rhizobium lusitanum]